MRSPHTSPSLRSIAHMHNRASYFPSPPSSPAPIASPVQVQHQFQHQPQHQHQYQHQTQHQHQHQSYQHQSQHQHQSYPITSSPLASPRLASPRQETIRPAASRRPTYTSAIPIGYNHVHPKPHSPSLPTNNYAQTPPSPRSSENRTQSLGDTRRRPSFKIDLPPRPAPSEILADQDHGSASHQGHTPYNAPAPVERPKLSRDEVGAGRKLSLGPLEMTDLRAEIDKVTYYTSIPEAEPFPIAQYIGKPPPSAPTFRDPFASVAPRPVVQEQSYVILRAPTRRLEEEGSPKWRENDPYAGAGAVGLGYSLNRLRAPTPWVRKSEEDGEWLSAEDVARM
jgi:hypothetical protein